MNLEATDYVDLISWQDSDLSEPLLTLKYSKKELSEMICQGRENDDLSIQIPKFLCHTQAVEWCIKLVASAVFGEEFRDGYIRAKLESRRVMPQFETKAQYVSRNK